LSLNILDQRDLKQFIVSYLTKRNRNLVQTGALSGSPAAFTCDNLVPLPDESNNDRLDDSVRDDRPSEFV
jgi:hypothetical protein